MSFDWFKQPENIFILTITLLLLVLHLLTINYGGLMLDELYYVTEAYAITEGESEAASIIEGTTYYYPSRPEHPPLGKLIIASGIHIFGLELFGCRIFSVLFGVAGIVIFYLICRKLTNNRYIPLIATYIFAFENMSFVMSSVAMLDVYGLTLMMFAFLLYLYKRYVFSGFVVSLAILAKLTFGFGLLIILLHWLFTRNTQKRNMLKFVITVPIAFVILLPLLELAVTGEFISPWGKMDYMVSTHSSATFADYEDTKLSRPWEWLISPQSLEFFPDPRYQCGVSWTLWALIIPSTGYVLYTTMRQKWNSFCLFAFIWFCCTYIIWIPIYFATDRVMYVFYFYPAIGSVCLAVSYLIYDVLALAQGQSNKKVQLGVQIPVILWILCHFIVFWIMSPVT